MTTMPFDAAMPAARLVSSWHTGQRLVALPEAERPASLAQAYAVQAAMVDSLGDGVAGWKIAGESPRGLRGEGPLPVVGRVIASRVLPSDSGLTLPPDTTMTLEAEVAVRVARSVSPSREALDVGSMIEAAHVAIEVVCSRFFDRKAVGQPSFVADNAGFHALVVGERIPFDAESMFDEDAGLWRDGERVGASLNGDARTRPFQSLGFLWRELARQGLAIEAGAIVTTGTLCVPVDTAVKGRYEARVGGARVGVVLG